MIVIYSLQQIMKVINVFNSNLLSKLGKDQCTITKQLLINSTDCD